MKFTRPLYRELFALGGDARMTAVNTFKERASFYHPICRSMVAKDLMVDLGRRKRGSYSGGRVHERVPEHRRVCFLTYFVYTPGESILVGGDKEKTRRVNDGPCQQHTLPFLRSRPTSPSRPAPPAFRVHKLACSRSRRGTAHPEAVALAGLAQHVANLERRQLRHLHRWHHNRCRRVGGDGGGGRRTIRGDGLLEGTPGAQKRGSGERQSGRWGQVEGGGRGRSGGDSGGGGGWPGKARVGLTGPG